jgi:hypothetical protein
MTTTAVVLLIVAVLAILAAAAFAPAPPPLKPRAKEAPAEVVRGIYDLLADPELAPARQYLRDMLLYVNVGRDRAKLTMDYVEQVERDAREIVRFHRQLERAAR